MNVLNNSTINNDTSNLSNSSKRKPNIWSPEEDAILIAKSKEYGYKNWAAVASFIKGRSAIQCNARYKRIQPGLIKGAWTPEEDQELLRLYKYYGKNWSNISKSMPQRTGKQIRDRFLNALDDNLKKDKFSIEEDRKVVKWYKVYGNAWCRIAKKIKGRTGDMVKNRFYSSLKNHLDDFDEEEENVKEGRKKRRYKKRKSTKKETMITGKRTKRQYTRKKKVNSDKTDVTNQNNNNEQDNKISISTSNTSNNTMNNVLFSTTAEVPFQEVIKPLPTNDAMLISSKTIGEDKNITGFNNQNKILLF